LWKKHVEDDEKLAEADRLTVSAAYRKWVQETDLGAPDGESVPPFTEVWLALNTRKRKGVAVDESPHDSQKGPAGRGRGNERFSEEEALRILAGALRMLQDEKRPMPVNASLVADRVRQQNPRFHYSRTRFGRLGDLLRRGEQEGWCSLQRKKDDILVTVLELRGRLAEEPSGQETEAKAEAREARDVENTESERKKAVVEKAPGGEQRDPLAEYAAEVDEVYRIGPRASDADDNGLRDELDRRAADRVGMEKLPRSPSRMGRAETLRFLDEVLKETCSGGHCKLPISASEMAGHMRKRFPRLQLGRTPFARFPELLRAAEADGLVKVSPTKKDMLITWVKYMPNAQQQLQQMQQARPQRSSPMPQRQWAPRSHNAGRPAPQRAFSDRTAEVGGRRGGGGGGPGDAGPSRRRARSRSRGGRRPHGGSDTAGRHRGTRRRASHQSSGYRGSSGGMRGERSGVGNRRRRGGRTGGDRRIREPSPSSYDSYSDWYSDESGSGAVSSSSSRSRSHGRRRVGRRDGRSARSRSGRRR